MIGTNLPATVEQLGVQNDIYTSGNQHMVSTDMESIYIISLEARTLLCGSQNLCKTFHICQVLYHFDQLFGHRSQGFPK